MNIPFEPERYPPPPPKPVDEFPEVWTTADGRKIKVSDMDEHHVRAALNMVIRRARRRELMNMLRLNFEMRAKHDIDWGDDLSNASVRGASQ